MRAWDTQVGTFSLLEQGEVVDFAVRAAGECGLRIARLWREPLTPTGPVEVSRATCEVPK